MITLNVSLKIGEERTVELMENRAAGFAWDIQGVRQDVIRIIRDVKVLPTPKDLAKGSESFLPRLLTVKGLMSGKFAIDHLIPGAPESRSARMEITVG